MDFGSILSGLGKNFVDKANVEKGASKLERVSSRFRDAGNILQGQPTAKDRGQLGGNSVGQALLGMFQPKGGKPKPLIASNQSKASKPIPGQTSQML
jgi:hypothetical protein